MVSKNGVIAGSLIGLILFLFQVSGSDFSPGLKLVALAPLAIITFMILRKQKHEEDVIGAKAIGSSIKLSAIAAVTVVVINLLIFFLASDYSFSKYSILPTNFTNFSMISIILFFEILVAGIMFSFILLQALKTTSKIE